MQKFKSITYALFAVLALVSSLASASAKGTVGGGGGDADELFFKEVAGNILEWITSGNADSISLPATISLADYKSRMSEKLKRFKVSFTSKTPKVKSTEKSCVNYPSKNSNRILCHRSQFQKLRITNREEVYRLIHHEFAGLAGLERNEGANSDYRISAQISGFLKNEVVLRLPVVPLSDSDSGATAELVIEEGAVVELEGKRITFYRDETSDEFAKCGSSYAGFALKNPISIVTTAGESDKPFVRKGVSRLSIHGNPPNQKNISKIKGEIFQITGGQCNHEEFGIVVEPAE